MIRLTCDKCERVLEVADSLAGLKIECPECGDVNLVPEPSVAGSDPAPTSADKRDPAQHGLPPDSGPEQRVMLVHPAMMRARPIRFFALVLVLIGSIVGGFYWGLSETQRWPVWICLIAGLASLATLAIWKVKTLTAGLEITNKRTIERRGLLSRASSEVVHDNIRNLQITQTFWQRLWHVGKIGLSSSGQDGIEIELGDLANPHKIRKIIDTYRPL